jgi:hypothetical protein
MIELDGVFPLNSVSDPCRSLWHPRAAFERSIFIMFVLVFSWTMLSTVAPKNSLLPV